MKMVSPEESSGSSWIHSEALSFKEISYKGHVEVSKTDLSMCSEIQGIADVRKKKLMATAIQHPQFQS